MSGARSSILATAEDPSRWTRCHDDVLVDVREAELVGDPWPTVSRRPLR
jgi:hypothetical protein